MPSNPCELHFHSKTGVCINLSLDCMQARRERSREEYNNAITFSNRPLNNGEIFAVALLDKVHTWQGSLEIGLTTIDPCSFPDDLPANGASLPETWVLSGASVMHDNMVIMDDYGRDLNGLCVGDVIGVMRSEGGYMHIFVNGEDIGRAAGPIPSPVWAVIDLYGKCAHLQIVPGYMNIHDHSNQSTLRSVLMPEVSSLPSSSSQLHPQPLSFHRICGTQIEFVSLTATYSVQRSNPLQEFNNGVVMSNRPLIHGTRDLFEIRIDEVVEKWSGSVEIGITSHDPVRLKSLPATMTNMRSGTIMMSGSSILVNGQGAGEQYSQFTLDDVIVGDRLGVELFADNTVHFYFNGTDLGAAAAVDPHQSYWAVVDLYGRTSAATVLTILPYQHNDSKDSQIAIGNSSSAVTCDIRSSCTPISDLVPLLFGSHYGSNVRVLNGGKSCQRKHSDIFNNGVVLTQRPLRDNEEFFVRLDKLASRWSGSLEVGVTDTLLSSADIPKTMTEFIYGHTFMLTSDGVLYNDVCLRTNLIASSFTWHQTPDMIPADDYSPLLRTDQYYLQDWTYPSVSDCYAVRLESTPDASGKGKIHFYVNQNWIGCVCGPIPPQLYGVVDLFGQACEATLLHPSPRSQMGHHLISARFHNSCERNLHSTSLSVSSTLSVEGSETQENSNPPFISGCQRFHQICGSDVALSFDKQTAYRAAPLAVTSGRGLVFSSTPLATNELFEVCLSGGVSQPLRTMQQQLLNDCEFSPTNTNHIQFGLTNCDPANVNSHENLSYLTSSVWYIEGGSVWHGGIAVNLSYSAQLNSPLPNDTLVGILCNSAGEMHVFLNGKDLGVACTGVPQRCYAVLNMFGEGCSSVHISETMALRTQSPTMNDNLSTNSIVEHQPLDQPRTDVTSRFRNIERKSAALRYSISCAPNVMELLQDADIQDHSMNKFMTFNKSSLNFSLMNSMDPTLSKMNQLSYRLNDDLNELDHATKSSLYDKDHHFFSRWSWVSSAHGILNSVCYHYTKQSPPDLVVSSHTLQSNLYYEMLFDDLIYPSNSTEIVDLPLFRNCISNFKTTSINMEKLPFSLGVACVDVEKLVRHASNRESLFFTSMISGTLTKLNWCCLLYQGGNLLCAENGVPLSNCCQDGFVPGLLASWPRRLRVGIHIGSSPDRNLTFIINGYVFPTSCSIPPSVNVRLCFIMKPMESPYGTCMLTRLTRGVSPPDLMNNMESLSYSRRLSSDISNEVSTDELNEEYDCSASDTLLHIGKGVLMTTSPTNPSELTFTLQQTGVFSTDLVLFRRQLKCGVPFRIRIDEMNGNESGLSIGIVRLPWDEMASRSLVSSLICPESVLRISESVSFIDDSIFVSGYKAIASSPIHLHHLQSGDELSLVMLESQGFDDYIQNGDTMLKESGPQQAASSRSPRAFLYLCSSNGRSISVPLNHVHGTLSNWRPYIFLSEQCKKISFLNDSEDKDSDEMSYLGSDLCSTSFKKECSFALKCDCFLRSLPTVVKQAVSSTPQGRQCFCVPCHDRRMLRTTCRRLLKRLLRKSQTSVPRDPEKSEFTHSNDDTNSTGLCTEKNSESDSLLDKESSNPLPTSSPLGWCRYSLRNEHQNSSETTGWPTAYMSVSFNEVIEMLTTGTDPVDIHSTVPTISKPGVKSNSPTSLQQSWCSNWLLESPSSTSSTYNASTLHLTHSASTSRKVSSAIPESKDIPGRAILLSPYCVPTLYQSIDECTTRLRFHELTGHFGLEVRVKPGSYKSVGGQYLFKEWLSNRVTSRVSLENGRGDMDSFKDTSCLDESLANQNVSQSKYWITKERNAVLYTALLIRVDE